MESEADGECWVRNVREGEEWGWWETNTGAVKGYD